MYEGPHLELFARRPRTGWVVWGDEVGPWPQAGGAENV
jgi:N6-adenosine-specific RNA methylase IME4